MLSFHEFFTACAGIWTTERTYHYVSENQIERSYTEFRVTSLTGEEKQQILTVAASANSSHKIELNPAALRDGEQCPGFTIAFDTRSETGEEVSMTLQALFVPDQCVVSSPTAWETLSLPIAAQVPTGSEGEVIQGFYLRDQGYSEAGAIAGRFTYQPTRRTLEMTTFYRRSIAVDQMRLIAPDLRLRTIVTYARPSIDEPASIINLVGFGVERKQVV